MHCEYPREDTVCGISPHICLDDPLSMRHPRGEFWGTLVESKPTHLIKEKGKWKSGWPKGMQPVPGLESNSKSFPRQCYTICPLPASVRVIGAVPGVPSPEGVISAGGESNLFHSIAHLQWCSTTLSLWGLFVLQVQDEK